MKGGRSRSISGDQTNLKPYGNCTSVMRPIVLMSTRAIASHAGTAVITRPSGSPDESESRVTAPRRRLVKAEKKLAFAGAGALTSLLRAAPSMLGELHD